MVKITARIEKDIIKRKKNGESDRHIPSAQSISRGSVYNIIQKHKINPPPPKMGRPPKVSQRVKNFIVQKIRNKQTRNTATASKLVQQEEALKVTPRHICNILHETNLEVVRVVPKPKMTPLHRQHRKN